MQYIRKHTDTCDICIICIPLCPSQRAYRRRWPFCQPSLLPPCASAKRHIGDIGRFICLPFAPASNHIGDIGAMAAARAAALEPTLEAAPDATLAGAYSAHRSATRASL